MCGAGEAGERGRGLGHLIQRGGACTPPCHLLSEVAALQEKGGKEILERGPAHAPLI